MYLLFVFVPRSTRVEYSTSQIMGTSTASQDLEDLEALLKERGEFFSPTLFFLCLAQGRMRAIKRVESCVFRGKSA